MSVRPRWLSAAGRLVLAALLIAAALGLAPRPVPGTGGARAALGPLAELGASLQWIRFQRARLAGDAVRAVELAESALALDPRSSAGWELLAAHLALYLGSPEREPDLARRRRLFAAGLETARRGAALADDPAELHVWRGVVQVARAALDPDVHPGGAGGLLAAAARAFAAAERAGHPEARELRRRVAELLAEAGPERP